jgi:hypothetical protein
MLLKCENNAGTGIICEGINTFLCFMNCGNLKKVNVLKR